MVQAKFTTSFPFVSVLPDVPSILQMGDNIVRLADADPDPALPAFVFEFAINPEERIDFKGSQSIAEIPIPSAEGSILQSVGSEPLRISWKGVLEDVFAADGGLVRRAIDDIQTLQDMRVSGKNWVFKYLDFEHTVKIKSFNYSPVAQRGNLDRFEYDIELVKFYPNLGFERQQVPSVFIQVQEQQSALTGIRAFFNNINTAIRTAADTVAAVSNLLYSPVRDFLGVANEIFDQLTETGDLVNSVIADAANGITTPQRDLEALQQRIDYNITTVQQMMGNISTIANAGQGILIALHDIEVSLTFLSQLPQLQPNPPTKYTVIDGDRIEDIADAFYGDAEAWRPIASANNLQNPSVLVPGQVLIIPV